MARKMQANQVLSNSIVKHLVKSVDETKLADLMTFLPQQVILYLLGEYTPLQVGDAYPDQNRFKDGKITYVNYLTGMYGIEYTYVEYRYFKTEEEAKKYSKSREYEYSTSSSSKKEEYPFKGEYTYKTSTETEWIF